MIGVQTKYSTTTKNYQMHKNMYLVGNMVASAPFHPPPRPSPPTNPINPLYPTPRTPHASTHPHTNPPTQVHPPNNPTYPPTPTPLIHLCVGCSVPQRMQSISFTSPRSTVWSDAWSWHSLHVNSFWQHGALILHALL